MRSNKLLFNASMALLECSKFIRPISFQFAEELLSKAEEYKDQIVIDEGLEKKVDEFAEEIRKGL